MKKIIKNFVKIAYSYEKTKIKTKKLHVLISFTLYKNTFFSNKSLQLCLIKNKILPFFENLPNNKQIRPLFYSNNIRDWGVLKSIANVCQGIAITGKWSHGFIKRKKEPVIKKMNRDFFLGNNSINMLVVPKVLLCSKAIKEAHACKIVSFGCVNFSDTFITDVTYFVIGAKNNSEYSAKFCLILAYLIKWKTYENVCLKQEQTQFFIKHRKYVQHLKHLKNEALIDWTINAEN